MPEKPLDKPVKLKSDQRADVYAVLDSGLVAHVAFALEGRPCCLPMVYARDGDSLLLHAGRGAPFFRVLAEGAPVCLTVTELDGLVLAKSGLRHSVNYRSVVVLGSTRPLEEEVAKRRALDRVVEHVIPGRMADARSANAAELAATGVLVMSLEKATFKARRGPPNDLEGDRDRDCWAGELPVRVVFGPPRPVAYSRTSLPDYLRDYRREVIAPASEPA